MEESNITYTLEFDDQAIEDIKLLKKSDKQAYSKLSKLQEYTELWADKNMMDRIRDSYGNQDWPNKDDKAYSSLFIDLMDDYNQRIKNEYFDISLPNDNVSGYTLKTLNSSLKYFRGLPSTSNYIKKYIAKPAGVTDAKLDELFKKYDEIW